MKLVNNFHDFVFASLFLSLLMSFVIPSFMVRKAYFVITPICISQENIGHGCVTPAVARSLIECASICRSNDICVGVSVSADNKCFLHQECSSSKISCDVMDANFTHLVISQTLRKCFHGGKWHFAKKRCVCKDGWIGLYCKVRGQTCDEIRLDGYRKGYVHVILDINRDGTHLIDVYCEITRSRSRALILASSGFGDFNRSWDQYVTGFGDTYDNIWLGLRNIYLLNQAGYNRLFIQVYFGDTSAVTYSRRYDKFHLMNSSDSYKFTFHKTRVTKGPNEALLGCLSPLQNTDVSTWDMDNDGDLNKNCASLRGAGWWYSDCDASCILPGYASAKSANGLPGIDPLRMKSHFKKLTVTLKLTKGK